MKQIFTQVTIWTLLLAGWGYGAEITVVMPGSDVTVVYLPPVSTIVRQDSSLLFAVQGVVTHSDAGEPDIPWGVLELLLPPEADTRHLSMSLDNADYSLIVNGRVKPVPPPATRSDQGHRVLKWPAGRVIEDGCDVAIYQADEFWPSAARLTHAGRLHQWQLMEAAVPLVRCNPVTGQTEELVRADLTIHYARTVRNSSHARAMPGEYAGRGRQRVRARAANYAALADAYEVDSDLSAAPASSALSQQEPVDTAGISSKGYVILTTSAVVAGSTQLADFAAHKQARGWDVSVVTESQWGGGIGAAAAVNIRQWLRAHYLSMDTLYVLLIGDPDPETGDVPMRWYNDGYESVEGGVLGAPTDALYSDLSTSSSWDKYWEVIVGRIPYYGSMSTLDAILLKTITYENSQSILWRWNALLPMVPLADDTPAYQCGEQISSQILIPNEIGSTRIYESTYGLNPAPEYLLAQRYPAAEWAGQPYGLVAWITHGWQTGATDVISTSQVSPLNDLYPSAVYEGSCQNAWPENANNLAYRILQNGGITTVAATRNSFYTPGQTNYSTGSSIGTLAYHYSDNLAGERHSCGLALAEAKAGLNLYKANAARMILYGDPSIIVFADPDFTPPSPNPMTWQTEPYESAPGEVTMAATTATDNAGGAVEYYFQCVSGGGRDSGWQSSPTYTDTSVAAVYNYYSVKARDRSDSRNETTSSAPAAVTLKPYPYGGQARLIPGRIQAEHFDVGGQGITYYDLTAGNSGGSLRTREDVDIVPVTDGTADYAVEAAGGGEWLQFTVSSFAEITDLYVRVASVQDAGQLTVSLDNEVLAAVPVPNTGSLSVWRHVKIPGLVLPERENALLKLEFSGAAFRLNWIAFQNQLPYPGTPLPVPGRIEFEDFDRGGQDIAYYDATPLNNAYNQYRPDEGVEIMGITDAGAAGYAVYAEAPEWLDYTCAVQPGFYSLVVRHTGMFTVQQITLLENDVPAAVFHLPATGSWNDWQESVVSDVFLSGGGTVLTFKMDAASVLLNHVDFIPHYNPADIDRSGYVDLADFSILASQWPAAAPLASADIAPPGGDGTVDLADLLVLVEKWLSF